MKRANKRLGVFMGLAVLFLFFLLAKTFHVQVIAAPELRDQAEIQSTRTITLAAPRGAIYDRDGEQLAVSRAMATVYANPKQVEDPAAVAAQLAPIVGRSQEDLLAKLSKKTGFEYLARKIEPGKGEQVKLLDIDGIYVVSEDKRFYPAGALAPQLLGFVGTDNEGLAGVELEHEELLSGEPGTLTVVSDLHGNRLDTTSYQEAVPGESLTLTIDADIQFEVEKILSQTVEQFQAKKACAVIMDPKTGEIIAMANTPVFDTNAYGSAEEKDRRNAAVVDMYEPGSTFKMVTVAAALQAGLVTPDTTFALGKTISLYDVVVHEAHEAGLPEVRHLTVREILALSSNIGAVTLGMEVGKQRLVEMIKSFGFTEELDIDFPGEAPGLMPEAEEWSGTTIANVPMGQGISVTPLQLAAAYAAIANDGLLVQPHLARGVEEPWSRRVVNEEVARQLRDMLQSVTSEEGTGTNAQVKGYEVAGKTGTAQKVKENGLGYADDKYVASFVGMVPASAPKLVILVAVDEPTTERLGAYVAAPAFAKIADFALKSLGIPPTSLD